MRSLLALAALLFCWYSHGQVSIYIEDQTGSGFKLGINGYIQNTDPTKQLIIQKLDTFPFDVRVELAPNAFFNKKMHFHERGHYHYIVTTNSRDELQLRYRGKMEQLPEAVITMDLQHVLPQRPLASTAAVSKKPIPEATPHPIAQEVPPENTLAEIDETTVEEQPVPPTPSSPNKPVQKAIAGEQQIQSSPSAETPKPTPSPVQTYEAFLTELRSTEFEFEKLNKSRDFARIHHYTLEELKQVLKVMKYDNTRLELIRALKAEIKEMGKTPALRESLEYEVSKQQFDNILQL